MKRRSIDIRTRARVSNAPEGAICDVVVAWTPEHREIPCGAPAAHRLRWASADLELDHCDDHMSARAAR